MEKFLNFACKPDIGTIITGVKTLLHALLSTEYRKQLIEAAEHEQEALAQTECQEHEDTVRRINIRLMQSILDACPEGYIIFYKFACGNWEEFQMREEAFSALEVVRDKGARWGYLQGSGLGCFNPATYEWNAEHIVDAITTEPNRWLQGTILRGFWYVDPYNSGLPGAD